MLPKHQGYYPQSFNPHPKGVITLYNTLTVIRNVWITIRNFPRKLKHCCTVYRSSCLAAMSIRAVKYLPRQETNCIQAGAWHAGSENVYHCFWKNEVENIQIFHNICLKPRLMYLSCVVVLEESSNNVVLKEKTNDNYPMVSGYLKIFCHRMRSISILWVSAHMEINVCVCACFFYCHISHISKY